MLYSEQRACILKQQSSKYLEIYVHANVTQKSTCKNLLISEVFNEGCILATIFNSRIGSSCPRFESWQV